MIGGEFASRLGPLAGLRPQGPFDDMTCDVCGAPNAVCTGDVVDEPERPDVEALVTKRAAQQTRRTGGRPPRDPAVREATETGRETIDAAGVPVGEPDPRPAGVPAGDPMEVRDLYVVPDGGTDPIDRPAPPEPGHDRDRRGPLPDLRHRCLDDPSRRRHRRHHP